MVDLPKSPAAAEAFANSPAISDAIEKVSNMSFPSEILFVDPSVSDLETILRNLRPEVQAIVLDGRWPATRQIAAALGGRKGLDAVHIVAHGAPGRVNFAAGEWSVGTLKEEADDFAAIGRALASDGELRLWSCNSALGDAGEAFIETLSEAVGAEVCASTALIGAAALGGAWELFRTRKRVHALAAADRNGVSSYAGVLPTTSGELTLTGTIASRFNC